MSSSSLPPASAEPSTFEAALLAVDKWFNTSPYAVYVPYVLGAVGLFFRFRSAREMAPGPATTVDEVDAAAAAEPTRTAAPPPSASATPTAAPAAAAASSSSSKAKGSSAQRRKGK